MLLIRLRLSHQRPVPKEHFVIATAPLNVANLKPPPELIQALKKHVGKLQMLPAVAKEALEMVKDPECSILRFTSVVKRDVKLTINILKLANCALYSPVTPIVDLNRCVMRIGFRECQNLILAASIAGLMNRVTMGSELVREALRRHSFMTAVLATRINRTLHLGFQGEEFTGGLLHDFGRILFAMIVPDSFPLFDPVDFDESPEQLEREFDATGTDHCRLGAWFTHVNQLPQPIPSIILHHHQPQLAVQHQRLTALIAVADQMANDWQRLGAGFVEEFEPPSALDLLTDDRHEEFVSEFVNLAPTLMEEAQRDADVLISAK